MDGKPVSEADPNCRQSLSALDKLYSDCEEMVESLKRQTSVSKLENTP